LPPRRSCRPGEPRRSSTPGRATPSRTPLPYSSTRCTRARLCTHAHHAAGRLAAPLAAARLITSPSRLAARAASSKPSRTARASKAQLLHRPILCTHVPHAPAVPDAPLGPARVVASSLCRHESRHCSARRDTKCH
jgi:hypothetical protein